MSRMQRLRDYKTEKGPKGESTMRNINYWSNRATENSQLAPRAKKTMDLPSTGEMKLSNSAEPYVADPRREAKADLNFEGSKTFMPRVRRNA